MKEGFFSKCWNAISGFFQNLGSALFGSWTRAGKTLLITGLGTLILLSVPTVLPQLLSLLFYATTMGIVFMGILWYVTHIANAYEATRENLTIEEVEHLRKHKGPMLSESL